MELQPLGDRALVKPDAEKEKTEAGIFIPEDADRQKQSEGEIIALGDHENIEKLGVNKGDKVLFGKYSGEDVEIEKEKYKLLKSDEVLALIK